MTNNATVLISENILKATADAIRNKGGASGSIKPVNFAETIKAIAAGGLDTSDATATAEEIFEGKTAYAQGRKLTGTFTIDEELSTQDDLITQITTALEGKAAGGEQVAPEISIDSSSGLVTATAGTKSSTYQLAFQAAKTITPGTASQIAVSSGYYTGGNVTVAGDSNLIAGNIKSGVSIFGVSGTAEVGGGTNVDDVSRTIIERTITEVSDNELQRIGCNTFAYCTDLNIALFPACTYIETEAFAYCHNLVSISFPVCSIIHSSAFTGCKRLTAASFPACTAISYNAFSYCHNLVSISFPVCSIINYSAFLRCSSLIIASFPVCTSIGTNAFGSCKNLTTGLFSSCVRIYSSAFRACFNLSNLQLRASSVCTLNHSNAFSSTPFAGYSTYFSGTPHIYVPSSLITAYQSATNWTYFSSYFSAIESLEE